VPTVILQYETGDKPFWATAKTVQRFYGIAETALSRLVEAGSVKSRKLPGDPMRAGRVYCLADIESWLEEEQSA